MYDNLKNLKQSEIADFDFLEYRIGQVKKDFKKQIESGDNQREKDLLKILHVLAIEGYSKNNERLMEQIDGFVAETTENVEDTEMINYNKWLMSLSS